MESPERGADKKSGRWFLRHAEDVYIRPILLPLVPKFIETYHLTMMTVLWSVMVVAAGWLARGHLGWLWMSSVAIILQYITDLLDGAVGRARDTGLVKWGFYMDHLLDYFFFGSLVLAYLFVFPLHQVYWLVALALLEIGFMLNTFLVFGVTQELRIAVAGVGPTEMRICFILFNTLLLYLSPLFFVPIIPYFVAGTLIILLMTIYHTHRELWRLDMAHKQ